MHDQEAGRKMSAGAAGPPPPRRKTAPPSGSGLRAYYNVFGQKQWLDGAYYAYAYAYGIRPAVWVDLK